jgi:hypothetical protein
MMTIIKVIAILLGLYLIDRVCLWLEVKGWLYYRKHKPLGGFLGNALLCLSCFMDPSIRHTIKVKQNQAQHKQCEADVPADPLEEKIK